MIEINITPYLSILSFENNSRLTTNKGSFIRLPVKGGRGRLSQCEQPWTLGQGQGRGLVVNRTSNSVG